MHGTIEYGNLNGYLNIISSVTLVPLIGAIWNTDVLAPVAVSRSRCSHFVNVNIVPCASSENRNSVEKYLILFYYCN